jgi:16S rRNA (uracil1498-N3)-methyltransferase
LTCHRITITPDQRQHNTLRLTADQWHYLNRVVRLGVGAQFGVMDGEEQWLAVITAAATAQIVSVLPGAEVWVMPLRLVMALPKQGFDQVVRQATELGASEIVPVISDRTLLRPSPQKLQRWRRIAQESAEQCERLMPPQISDPRPLTDYWSAIASQPRGPQFFCVARRSVPTLLAQLPHHDQAPAWTVITGPEGGWSGAEVEAAIAAGADLVSLGSGILRAVTAPLAALALCNAYLAGLDPREPSIPTASLGSEGVTG